MKRRVILCLMVCIMLLCVFQPIEAYADASDIDATLATVKNESQIANVCNVANASVGVNILNYDGSAGLLRFSSKVYRSMDLDDREEFMETALVAVTKTSLNAKVKNQVYNFISEQDTAVSAAMKYLQTNTGTDLVEAKKWFAPFESTIGTILGFLCILIFLFLGMSILFDIFYLVLPPFQAVIDREESGKKPFGVSREAYSAQRDAEKDDEYRNVLALYFKRRVGVIIAVAIAITYLVSGKIYDVIVFIIDAFS